MQQEQLSGFFKVIARARIEKQLTKPFLGKPFLRFGQCYFLCTYFFRLGAILGAKHNDRLEAFSHAFLGIHGESSAVDQFYSDANKKIIQKFDLSSIKFHDYVSAVLKKRVGFSGDDYQFSAKYFMTKTPPDTSIELMWQFAVDGASIGVKNPELIPIWYNRTNIQTPQAEWDLARSMGPDIPHLANSIGIDIPPEEDVMSYEEVEEAENGLFMAYCQECCPDLHFIINS